MAEMEKEEFKFPDEVEQKAPEAEEQGFEIEIEDDTPPEDRNREPMPKEIVEKLEKDDDLDKYTDDTKEKIKQLKKVWNDERREKDAAHRERQAAIDTASKLLAENKRMRELLNSGQKDFIAASQQSAELQLEMAKKAYKEAYEAGDVDKVVEAQAKLNEVTYKLQRVKDYKPSLQTPEVDVNSDQEQQAPVQVPRLDPKTAAWQERNSWFGQDEEMTALALGLHEKLVKENGMSYATTDEYYQRIDNTMRKRFPENFEEEQQEETVEAKPQRTKPSTVVAPATRSTGSKKVRLTTTQMATIKKLGLTPEQYVREVLKMEAQ